MKIIETTRARAQPNEGRAALMRKAADLIGSERLAKALGISSRSIYWMMSGQRPVKDGVLADTRQLLIAQRQAIGDLVQEIRDEESPAAAGMDIITAEQREAARRATREVLGDPKGKRP